MSAAGDCPRLLDYKLQHGRKEADLLSAMRLLTGEPIHQFYREILAESFGDDYQMAEAEVTLDIELGPPIVGHCDGFINSLGYVVEVKTVGESTFTMVKNLGGPLPAHLAQANLYAFAIQGSKAILFIYHNRNSGEYLTYVVPKNADLFSQTMLKFKQARERQAQGVMIPRPYNDPTESPCFFCDNKQDCYKNFDQEIVSGTTVRANEQMEKMAEDFMIARQLKLSSEKLADAAKDRMIDSLIREKITVLCCESATFTIKPGKTGKPLMTVKEVK